ncbi:MAG: DMT family transporter [Oscillospiraceae bacterium]|nr:DMT family transporter [Oscillospiraceae bacterium]
MKLNPSRVALLFVFLASAIWGGSFVTQKIAGMYMGSFTYNGVRFALGALSLLPVIKLLEKPDRAKTKRTLLAGAAGGAVVFFASNLQQFGIVLSKSPSSAGEAGFITGMYIIFVPILGLFLKRKTSPLVWLSAVLAFGGLALISTGAATAFRVSDLLLVLCAVFWAAHILLIGRFVDEINPIRFAAVQFVVCSVLSLISAFIFEDISLQGLHDGLGALLFGGIVASGAAYTLQVLGQRRVEPSKAAIIFSLEALFAALSEAVFLGEIMTPRKYVGGAIIFTGILLSQRRANKTSNAGEDLSEYRGLNSYKKLTHFHKLHDAESCDSPPGKDEKAMLHNE